MRLLIGDEIDDTKAREEEARKMNEWEWESGSRK